MNSQQRLPMKFYKTGLPFIINETEGMYPKPFHHSETTGNSAVGHHPHNHMHRFRHQGNKIPKGIVCGARLWNFIVRLGFDSMNQVRKFNGVLNKKYGYIIAYQVIIAFLRIELNSKSFYTATR